MSLNEKSLNKLLPKCIISVVIVYLIFTLLNYALTSYELSNSIQHPFSFIISNTLSVLRTLTIIAISIKFRKDNYNLIKNTHNIQIYSIFALVLFIICIVVNIFELPMKFLGTLSASIGIYNSNLFLIILWEQIFYNWFISHLLLCIVIVFLVKPKHVNSHCKDAV